MSELEEKMGRLEGKIAELTPETEERLCASDLYSFGYDPKRDTMRKTVGNFEVCYREEGGYFKFVALVKK